MYIYTVDEKPGAQCLKTKRHRYAEDSSSSDEETDVPVKVIVVIL